MARIRSILCSGDWVSWARIRSYCAILATLYVATWAYLLAGAGHLDPLGRAVGTDFAAFYAISRALLGGIRAASLYSPAALNEIVRPFTNGDTYIWLYPPTALLPYLPLGLLPYLGALAAWNCAGVAAYLAVVWRVLPGLRALAAAAIFPAVFVSSMHGHNGFLIAACLGFGLVLLPTRPIVAGLLLGLVSIKPHLALLVPIALLAGRQWRALAAAVASALFLAGAVTLAFGTEPWRSFIESSVLARAMLETGGVPYTKIASLFSSVRVLGGGIGLAYAVQGVAATVAGAAVVWLWARPSRYEVRAATHPRLPGRNTLRLRLRPRRARRRPRIPGEDRASRRLVGMGEDGRCGGVGRTLAREASRYVDTDLHHPGRPYLGSGAHAPARCDRDWPQA